MSGPETLASWTTSGGRREARCRERLLDRCERDVEHRPTRADGGRGLGLTRSVANDQADWEFDKLNSCRVIAARSRPSGDLLAVDG